MGQVTIYHNPRCSKSRETLKLLQENGVEPKVVEYLDNPPSKTQLKNIAKMLNLKPIEFMRVKEKEFKDMGLSKSSSDTACLEAMAECPKLIERPIVIAGKKAALGRPPENVLEIIG